MQQKQLLKLGLAVMFFSTMAVHAQITSIRGRVTDQTGANIAKAQAVLKNEATGEELNSVTTSTGDYSFVHIPTGVYDVTVTSTGFVSQARSSIRLDLDAILSINFSLKPGAASETVTVQASEIILNTTNADRGTTFTHDEIENSPENSGTPLLLANSAPGVVFTGTYNGTNQFVRPFDNSAINQFSVNGQGGDTNDFQLDGAPNNSNSFGSRDIGYIPPTASVQEMKFISNAYDAQYGHTGGGVFDIVTKNGTNKLHGQVYENARRTWLDANSYNNDSMNAFNPQVHLAKAGDNRDQYGFQVDGPVVIPHFYNGHDKTFFSVQGENYKQNTPLTGIDSVPALSPGSTTQTVAQTGDFSQATYYDGNSGARLPIIIYDPLTLNAATHDRAAFAGNIIPMSRISQVAQNVLSYFPLPNIQTPIDQYFSTNNHEWSLLDTDRYKTAIMRVDQQFSEKDRGYLRYTWNKRFENRPFTGVTGAGEQGVFPLTRQNHFFTADYTHTFGPNAVLDVRASFTRYSYNQAEGANFDPTTLGFGGIASAATFKVFPQVNVNYLTSLGNDATNGGDKLTITNTISGLPLLTLVKGPHQIKIGLDYRWQKASNYTGGASSGYFHSDNYWTQKSTSGYQGQQDGNATAAWLLGTPSDAHIDINPNLYFSYPYFAPFVQDDWKISSRLTLNLGVRWDFQGPPSELRNRISVNFDTNAVNPVVVPGLSGLKGGLTYAGVNGQPTTFYGWNKNLIQPRIGFAFAATPTTVLRGGIGDTFVQNATQGDAIGFSQTTNMNTSNSGGLLPDGDHIDDPFPVIALPAGSSRGLETNLGGTQYVSNQRFKIPGVLNYSLGVTQQFTPHDTFDISYVGSRGFNLSSNNDINHVSAAYQASCDILHGATVQRLEDCVNYGGSSAWSANPFLGNPAFSTVNTGNQNGYYTTPLIFNGNLTRPFPEFGSVYQYERNEGKTRFDSLQLVGTHRWTDALTIRGNYVWSKVMTSGYVDDTVYQTFQRHIDSGTRPWRFTMNAVWHLPVGRGRTYLGHTNRVVDGLVGGWIFSPVYYYEAGTPQLLPANIVLTHPIAKQRSHYTEAGTGINFIRATSSCVGFYDPSNNYKLGNIPGQNYTNCKAGQYDFIQLPPFAQQNDISDNGIRNPNGQQMDIAMSKSFTIYERLALEVRLESYNVLNHPSFQGAGYYFGNIGDPHWGTINDLYQQQTNPPRQSQISAKVTF
jgi:hypothetical protein